jgi:hypothetical protein
MTREQRLDAMRAGQEAGRSGASILTCPYSTQGTPTERALAGAWVREYLRAKPANEAAVSYDG